MTKISLFPPSGFRDFSPQESLLRQNLVQHISATYQQFGFQPISITTLENLAVLQGKGGGSDNEKLIFKVLRRGDDLKNKLEQKSFDEIADMGLRFDLTLPLARYYAGRRQELPKPFKVFQIAPVWRADRPQKGRYREFYQCDVDVIGSSGIGAEIECISAIANVFISLQITDIKIVLNDRRLLSALGVSLSIAADKWQATLVTLDKLDKIGVDGVKKELLEKNTLDAATLEKLDTVLLQPKENNFQYWQSIAPEAVESLQNIVGLLQQAFPSLNIRFLPTLVRGQDYYTGTIFEIHHDSLNGSLGGGGRYDRLLELFQSENISAFGGSIGFERLCIILEERGSEASKTLTPQIFIPLFADALRAPVIAIASELRARGLRVDVFPDSAKLKNQFKYADDRKIPFTLLLGEDELARKIVKVKDMTNRTEEEIPLSEIAQRMEKLCK